MRVITHSAESVRELRRTLKLSQREFAELLGVSRRTIIRAEQRGLEIPRYSLGSIDRYELPRLWELAQKRAADVVTLSQSSAPKVSPRKGAG